MNTKSYISNCYYIIKLIFSLIKKKKTWMHLYRIFLLYIIQLYIKIYMLRIISLFQVFCIKYLFDFVLRTLNKIKKGKLVINRFCI